MEKGEGGKEATAPLQPVKRGGPGQPRSQLTSLGCSASPGGLPTYLGQVSEKQESFQNRRNKVVYY